MANLLKGAATRRIIEDARHPLQAYAPAPNRPPQMWATHLWKVYLDSENAIEEAIAYVHQKAVKEAKPEQNWTFVTPVASILASGWVNDH